MQLLVSYSIASLHYFPFFHHTPVTHHVVLQKLHNVRKMIQYTCIAQTPFVFDYVVDSL